jgi:hypothetical protein
MIFRIDTTERAYVVQSVDSNTQLTLTENYAGVTGSAKTYTLYQILQLPTNGTFYLTGEHIATVANRLVIGAMAITTNNKKNRLYFSGLTASGETIGHSWSSGDFHDLPDNARITGLAPLGDTLIIFTTAGIWTLDGLAYDIVDADGNPQHRLQRLSDSLILAGANGIVSQENALIVPCLDGIYRIDGVSAPQRLSTSIDPYYRAYTDAGRTFGQASVYHDHYLLPVLDASLAYVDLLVCRLDRAQGSSLGTVYPWTRFDGFGANVCAFAVHISSAGAPKLIAASRATSSRVLNCADFFSISTSGVEADSTAHDLDVKTRLHSTGGNTLNAVRKVKVRYELDEGAAPDPTLSLTWTDDLTTYSNQQELEEDATGTGVGTARINQRVREIGYRLSCNDSPAKFVIRSIETFLRPSGTVRR